MDYLALTDSVKGKVMEIMAIINNPEIAPDVRQLYHETLFRAVGDAIYVKVYDMNAFDMEIPHTKGAGIDNRYYGMAKTASDSVSTGSLGLDEQTQNFLASMSSMAQDHAFTNASQSGKHPTVTRSLTGRENCKWCDSLAGKYTDPSPDVFRRHSNCDCKITTAGYKSRNGLLDNYKGKK